MKQRFQWIPEADPGLGQSASGCAVDFNLEIIDEIFASEPQT